MKIEISSSYDLPGLAGCWTELETRADGNFFLSWRWIGTWLRTTALRPLLVKATEADKILALGLLTPLRRRRHLLSISQLYLHESGVADFDALTIEYNGFLIARDAPRGLAANILRQLQTAGPDWDEIVMGGIPSDAAAAIRAAGLHVEMDRSSPHFGVDLSAAAGWEDTLSANQRAQLRQSRSFAQRSGPLKLEQASSTQQALDYFEKMAVLHTQYWRKRNKPGAFASDFSQTFHRELIADQAGQARVALLQLTAGSDVLGYLYNFQYAGRVSNYQSGFCYGDDNRHRPGLIAHAFAIAQASSQGMQIYDFLAGDASYKARLGRPMGTLLWCRAQKNRPVLKAERAVRRLYRKLRGGSEPV
jgi:CelD/BcsL family acetyltransferase involved in cellulose biosynthesis